MKAIISLEAKNRKKSDDLTEKQQKDEGAKTQKKEKELRKLMKKSFWDKGLRKRGPFRKAFGSSHRKDRQSKISRKGRKTKKRALVFRHWFII